MADRARRTHLFLMLILALSTAGCYGMASAMSALNEGLGSQCATYYIEAEVFDNHERKWVGGHYPDDRNWVDRRLDYYLAQFRFLTVEETAPSGNRYRFETSCASYY